MKITRGVALAVTVLGLGACSASTTTETNANAVYVGTYTGAGTVSFTDPRALNLVTAQVTVNLTLSQIASTLSGTLAAQTTATPATVTSGGVTGQTTSSGATLEYVQTSCGGRATGSFTVQTDGSLSGSLSGTGCDPVTGVSEPMVITFVGLVRP